MADPGYPRGGGANSTGGGHQHTILPKFPINCTKLKEFGPPLDPPLSASEVCLCRSATKILQKEEFNLRMRYSKLDPDWLAPHHPIPNAKFPPITAFLKLAFSPLPCPATFSRNIFPQDFPARFSHKIFLQDFPARFSRAGS